MPARARKSRRRGCILSIAGSRERAAAQVCGQETWKWYRRPGATRGSNLPGCPIVLLALLYFVFRLFLDAFVDSRRSDGSLPAGAPGPRRQLRVHECQVQVCRRPFPVSSTGRVRSRPIVNRDDHASSAFRGRRGHSGMVILTTSRAGSGQGGSGSAPGGEPGWHRPASRLNPTGACSDLDVLRLGVGKCSASTVRRWPIASISRSSTAVVRSESIVLPRNTWPVTRWTTAYS